jgi:hypothetical protein
MPKYYIPTKRGRTVTPPSPFHASYSTSFPLVENPLSESGLWINGQTNGRDWTNMRVSPSGKAIGTETGSAASIYDDSTALLTGTWSNNQQARGTIFTTRTAGNWNSEVEMRLRSALSIGINRGYEFNVRIPGYPADPYIEIIRWNGAIGSFTALLHTDNASWVMHTGDQIRATAIGSVLTSYLTIAGFNGGNGVGVEFQAGTYNTSTGNDGGAGSNPGGPDSVIWSDGNPGMGSFCHDFGATSDITLYGFTFYEALSL